MADYEIKKLAYDNNNYTIVDSAAQTVLKAIINTGPKNLLPGSRQYGCDKSGEGVCEYVDIPVRVVPGRYVLYADTVQGWGGTMVECLVELHYDNGSTQSEYLDYGFDQTTTIEVSYAGTVEQIRIYANSTASSSVGCGMRILNAMLVHESLWNFDPTFVDYRRNLAEIEYDLDRDTEIVNARVDSTGIKNYAAFTRRDGTYGPYYGTTFVVANGVVTCSSSSANTGYKNFRVIGDVEESGWSYGVPLPKGKYILTGLPSGASASTFRAILGVTQSSSDTRVSTSIYGDYEFEITTDTGRIDLSLYVAQGNATNASFKPMICRVEDYEASTAYVAPSKTMAELTAKVAELIDVGSKNLIDMRWMTSPQTINGVQWTIDTTSGTVTGTRVSSNSNASTLYLLAGENHADIPVGYGMVLSGCPEGGSTSTYELQLAWKPTNSTIYRENGDGNGLKIPAGTVRYVACVMRSGQTGTVTFNPMLCSEDDWSWSKNFVPHK